MLIKGSQYEGQSIRKYVRNDLQVKMGSKYMVKGHGI
jgi:hypothetical protein